MKKRVLFFTCCAYFSSSISFSSQVKVEKNNLLSPNNNIELGTGFLHNSKLPMYGRCLKAKSKLVGPITSSIKLSHTIDINDLAKTLNVDMEAKAGWSNFSANSAIDYLNSIKGDDYSLSFSYQNTISTYVALDISDYYGVGALSEGAAAAYNASPDEFIKRCGDSYIQGLNLGAVLDVTMLVRFNTQEQKKKFEAVFDGKIGGIANASAKVKNAMERSNFNGSIEVVAYQRGGDPTRLQEIFGSSSEHHIVKCSLTSLDECTKAVDDIIDYAQAHGKWAEFGFANQINIRNGQLEEGSLYPISLAEASIASYDDLGLHVGDIVPSEDTLKAQEHLNTLYHEFDSKLIFAKSVLNSSAFHHLGERGKKKIQTIIDNLNLNRHLFRDGKAMNCFFPTTQHTCAQILKKIEKSIVPIDEDQIALLRGSYYVNVARNWPLVFVSNSSGTMDIYTIDLNPAGTITHDLKLTSSSDYSYISLGGGYSTYNNGIQTRYYMDFYGSEDLVYSNPNGIGYLGVTPWNTCVGGICSKKYYTMEIIPF